MNTAPSSAPAEEARWLTADQQRVWRSYIEATTLLDDHLDRQLQRDAGMPHLYYGLLVALAESPEHRLRMEGNGWLRRENCPDDKRGQFAVLTDEGLEVLRRTAPGHVQAVRQALFDRLSPEQQKALGEIMKIVAEGLQPSEAGADLPWLR